MFAGMWPLTSLLHLTTMPTMLARQGAGACQASAFSRRVRGGTYLIVRTYLKIVFWGVPSSLNTTMSITKFRICLKTHALAFQLRAAALVQNADFQF